MKRDIAQFSNTVTVEHGVVIPNRSYPTRTYPWRTMKPGDSFFVPQNGAEFASVRSSASYFASKNPGYKFTARRVYNPEPGIRVWRIKAPEIVYGANKP